MKRGKNSIVLTLLFVTCYLLFGCNNIFDIPLDAPQPQPQPEAGYGRVAVIIKGALTRTVFPMMAFARYEYFFARVINGQRGVPEEQVPIDDGDSAYFMLELGGWQVTVNAYANADDTEPAATGTSSTFTIDGETIAQIAVQLASIAQAGTGNLIYRITYPDDAQINIFTLENLLEEQAAVISISGNGEAGEGAVLILSGTEESMPAGIYYLTIQLKENGAEGRTTGANEVVYIYDKLDSEYRRTFTEEDFSHIHEWGNSTTNMPTETEDGFETKVCALDLTHIETHILYATGTPGLYFEAIGYPAAAYRVRRDSVSSGAVHIPAMHRPDADSPYLPVTEIGDYAFDYYTGLSSITIPTTVTSIGSCAFRYCNGLTSIEIPASVTSIGDSAFRECYNLAGINIPAGVTSIGSEAFRYCGSLTGIEIPASVTSIGDSALSNCGSLTGITVNAGNPNYASESGILYNKAKTILITAPRGISGNISIPAGVTSIGYQAFSECTSLTGITLPATVTNIGDSAFRECYNLTGINIPAGVTSIGSWAFYYCSSLTGIEIPASVTSIGDSAFRECYNLVGINIPAGVTSIGSEAFRYCNSLTGIAIPASVTSIGDYAFNNCGSLTGITVNANNPNYASEGGILYNKAKTTLITVPRGISGNISIPAGVTTIGSQAFYECSGLTGITLPATVTSIGDSAFNYCYNLAGINIPAGVTSIGSYAFRYCSSLTSIEIPAAVTSIGDYAFQECYNLAGINIPAGVTSIGSGAFYYCNSLTSIAIPASVTSIGDSAFNNCGSLSSIIVDGNNPSYTSEASILYNKAKTQVIAVAPAGISGNISIPAGITSIGSRAFYNCTGLTGIEIPEGVTSIGDSAFQECTSLTSITIPASVTGINSYAFYNCTSLTGITIPAGVTYINYAVFYNCTSLTDITIPASVTGISSEAFRNCAGLTSITIPADVTYIGDYVFLNCGSLTGITIDGNNQYYASQGGILYNKAKTTLIAAPGGISGNISIPAGVTSINSAAFYNCTSLTGITLPASVTSINSEAFRNCTGLTGITIPAKVTYIGDYAFNNCTSLAGITLPAGITSISYYAFGDCTGITSITIPASVTSIGSYAFTNWTNAQTINIMGHADQAAADAAWGSDWKYNNCNAVINYAMGAVTATTWREGSPIPLEPPFVGFENVTEQGWQISDNGSDWTSFTPPAAAAMSHNGGYLRYYVTSGDQTYYSNTVTILVISGTIREISIVMWDSSSDGWDAGAALRIDVNGTYLGANARLESNGGPDYYTFDVDTGDVIQVFWVSGGQFDSEIAFAVYYSDEPPNPAFDPTTGTTDSGKVLVSKQYNDPSGAVGDGTLLGSFTVP